MLTQELERLNQLMTDRNRDIELLRVKCRQYEDKIALLSSELER